MNQEPRSRHAVGSLIQIGWNASTRLRLQMEPSPRSVGPAKRRTGDHSLRTGRSPRGDHKSILAHEVGKRCWSLATRDDWSERW